MFSWLQWASMCTRFVIKKYVTASINFVDLISVDRFQLNNLLAPLIGGFVGTLLLVILILVLIAVVGVSLMRCGRQKQETEDRNDCKLTLASSHWTSTIATVCQLYSIQCSINVYQFIITMDNCSFPMKKEVSSLNFTVCLSRTNAQYHE